VTKIVSESEEAGKRKYYKTTKPQKGKSPGIKLKILSDTIGQKAMRQKDD